MRNSTFVHGASRPAAVALLAVLAIAALPVVRADAPLYLVDTPFDPPQASTVYTIDPASGAMAVRADLGGAYSPVLALAAADGTTLYAAGTDTTGTVCTSGSTFACLLLRIVLDPASSAPASVIVVGPFRSDAGPLAGITGMTFRNDGVLYMESQDTSGLYVVDPATAQATFVATAEVPLHGGDITFDSGDRLSVWTNDAASQPGLYRIDPSSGAATSIASDPGSLYAGLAAVGHADALYAANVVTDRLYGVDPDAGFTGYSVPMTIDGSAFDHKRGDLDSPWCAGDAACDDADPCTTDRCTPGGCRHLSIDATCDGLDDDCDGLIDEDYVPVATACGVGACATTGATSCVAGAIVDGCAPAPAQAETCNGVDDDCDGGIDNGVTTPARVATLLVDREPSGAVALSWTAAWGAQAYQVTRGDLDTLRATAGDFAASTNGCVADVPDTSAVDAAPPEAGGAWYLVRASNCGGAATFDEPAGSQSASRDAGIAASSSSCP